MRRPAVATVVVCLLALAVQLVLLPLVSRDLNSANCFLALLAVLGVRQKRLAGVLWGAVLGGLTDALLMQHAGYHGIAFTLLGYGFGWLGEKMVITGRGALFTLTFAAVLLDAALVTALFSALERPLAAAVLWGPVAVSAAVTPLLALGLERVYRLLARGERP